MAYNKLKCGDMSMENALELSYESLKEKYDDLKWKERYLEIINDFALYLMELDTTEEIVWGIAKKVIAKMNFEDCVVYLYDKEQDLLIQKAAHGPKNPDRWIIQNPITIPLGAGIVGSVAKNKMAEIIDDTRLDNRYILDDRMRLSEIAIPILYDNELIGVIDSEHSEVGFYSDQHLQILTTIAGMVANRFKSAIATEILERYKENLEKAVEDKTKTLQETIEELKRSNLDLESFAYAASHDLQEPLRTVTSYIQLLLRQEPNMSSSSKEYIEFIVDGTKRMKSLLDGLMSYSRLGSFKEEEEEKLNMNDIMAMVRANLGNSLAVNLAEIYISNLHPIVGNKTQVLQIFQNIMSNALKFKHKDKQPTLKISSKELDKFIEFTIADNGIGIPEEFQEKIFSLFVRLNPIGTYEGSGIGLALCKRIMDHHGGEIAIKSKVGEGTTFFLRFPKKYAQDV